VCVFKENILLLAKPVSDLPQGKSSSLEYDEYEDADPVSKTGKIFK